MLELKNYNKKGNLTWVNRTRDILFLTSLDQLTKSFNENGFSKTKTRI